MRAGSAAAGFLLVAVLAAIAQCGALGGGLVWDDAVLVGADPRIRDLSFVFRAFAEPYFGPGHDTEMYRPLVTASFALDWWLSGSEPGDVAVVWFDLVNLALHASVVGVGYLFLRELTGRSQGAPLFAATLMAVHPLAVEPTSWIVGRCDLLAALFGLLSAWLLIGSVGKPRRLAASVVCFGIGLFAKASIAPLPIIVWLALVAYRGVPWKRLFGRRVLSRFAWFALPSVLWLGARVAVLGAPFPVGPGRRWSPERVETLDALLGVGRAVTLDLGHLLLPVRLVGDYSADPATLPHVREVGLAGPLGLLLLASAMGFGLFWLRRRPRVGWPMVTFGLLLIPVLQLVPIGAIVADRFLYLPMLAVWLLVGEGLERVAAKAPLRWAWPLPFVLFGVFGLQSHLRARAWTDDIAFWGDVLEGYPAARDARFNYAKAIWERNDPGDRDEARRLMTDAVSRLSNPDYEAAALGEFELEAATDDAALQRAEEWLLHALELAGGKRSLGARVRHNLAVLAARRGDDEAALRWIEEALERVPDEPRMLRLRERLAE